MNEHDARAVLLVRAVESADAAQATLTADDRRHASRAAGELARWHAADRGTPASAEHFVVRRASLLLDRIVDREPAVARVARAVAWRPWIGVVVPLLALVAGALLENVSDRGHVNVLAFPLLAIVAWNFVVYVLLASGLLLSAVKGRPALAGVRRWLAGLGRRAYAGVKGPAASALATFVSDWSERSGPLMGARAARVLHLSAALFAIGAVAGLYVRGLVFEYRAGWESTFLDAHAVHSLLAFVLTPAAHLLGMPFPSEAEVAAIRFSTGTPGENAARWIHLYAVTVGVAVIVPRLLLAAFAGWRARANERRFPVDLDEPYFRRLLGGFATGPVRLRVVPYSYTLEETSIAGLRAVAKALLGEEGELVMRPAVAFGEEDAAAQGIDRTDAAVVLTLALFNLAATPETENHGLFLDRLAAGVGTPVAVIVDEAPYRKRLGAQAGATERLNERREGWRAFCESRRLAVSFVDLASPDLALVERDLGQVPARRNAA